MDQFHIHVKKVCYISSAIQSLIKKYPTSVHKNKSSLYLRTWCEEYWTKCLLMQKYNWKSPTGKKSQKSLCDDAFLLAVMEASVSQLSGSSAVFSQKLMSSVFVSVHCIHNSGVVVLLCINNSWKPFLDFHHIKYVYALCRIWKKLSKTIQCLKKYFTFFNEMHILG